MLPVTRYLSLVTHYGRSVRRPWIRRLLKILLVYVVACVPEMWSLAMLGPPMSFASLAFILVTSFAAPPVYVYRIIGGELSYLAAFAPFALIFSVGAVIVWLTERGRR